MLNQEDKDVKQERLLHVPTIQANMPSADCTALQYGYKQNIKVYAHIF